LTSTLNDRICDIELHDGQLYTISHQITKPLSHKSKLKIDDLLNLKNVKYSLCSKKGVAANRNNSISNRFSNCYYIVSDDDVFYDYDKIKSITNYISKYEAITFQIMKSKNIPYKHYSNVSRWHNLFSIGSVGSIEIGFSERFISKMNLFNEKFGPGSKNHIGEDFIFMFDNVVRNKNKIRYCPIPFVYHPNTSTGFNFKSKKIILGRGAMFRECFGFISFIISFIWSVKKYPKYKQEISFFEMLKNLLIGNKNFEC
jgi:hypothetical protein